MPSLLEAVMNWTEADAVFNTVPRLLWMQQDFLWTALSSRESSFRKYFIEASWSEMRLLRHILEFEGSEFPRFENCF